MDLRIKTFLGFFFRIRSDTNNMWLLNSRWIDPTPGSLLSMYMDVDGCQNNSANTVNYVEHVQCRISLKFFPRGDLRIVLTSPMGTESVLLFERPLDIISSTFDDWPFLSVHYWGEKIVGRWQLKITRRMANSTAKSPGNKYLCNPISPTYLVWIIQQKLFVQILYQLW